MKNKGEIKALKHGKMLLAVRKTIVVVLAVLMLSQMSPVSHAFAKPNIAEPNIAEPNIVSVTYSFDEFEILNWLDTKQYMTNYQILSIAGEPLVPYETANILLPPYTEVVDVSVQATFGGQHVVDDIPCGQPPAIIGEEPTIVGKNPIIYSSDELYPEEIYRVGSVKSFRGYNILDVQLYSVQYKPSSKQALYYTEMIVQVKLKKGSTMDTLRNLAEDRETVENLVDNPSILTTYDSILATVELPNPAYEYLIITTAPLADEFQVLADWKAYFVDGAKVETVRAGASAEEVKSIINDYYTNYGTSYVLLGGDVGVISYHTRQVMGTDIAEDYWFANLVGDDDISYYEVYIGRAPVDNDAEAAHFVEKVISFEQMDKPTANLFHQSRVAPGNYPDSRELAWQCEQYVPAGYTHYELFEEDGKIEKTDWIDFWRNDGILCEHIGHGSPTAYDINLEVGGEVIWYNTDVPSMDNTFWPVHTSVACFSGEFEYEDCLAEAYVKDDHGAIACFMNDKYGWFSWGDATMFSGDFIEMQFYALYQEGHQNIGAILAHSKYHFIDEATDPMNPDSVYWEWCWREINLIGDPETPVLDKRETFKFGYEGDYLGGIHIENYIVGSWFTCPQNGKALAMSIRVQRNPGAQTSPVRCAIYRKSDGSFVAQTEEIYVGYSSYHWVTLEFVTPPYLSAGEDYWLVAWAGGSIYFYIGIQEWETPKLGLQSLTYGNFPTTYSPNIYNYIANIYCTVLYMPDLTVRAEDQYGNSLTTGDVYVNGELVGYTGSTFVVKATHHEIFVNDFWEAGKTGYRYGFTNWEDGSTDNPRTINVGEPTTITARFFKKWCPGDVDGSGVVDDTDLDIASAAWFSARGDPNWDSRVDVDCNGFIDISDVSLIAWNYGKDYRIVGNWRFDEGSGSTAGDSSLYGNTGTIYGATWTTGKGGYALSFDGVNDYVRVANAPSLMTKNAITVQAWVKPENPSAIDKNKAIFRDGTFNFQPGFQYATRTFRFEVNIKGVGWVGLVTDNYAVDWGVWQHFACTYDGSYMRIYKNGIEIKSKPQTGEITAPDATLQIGCSWIGQSNYKGTIDEVCIYDRALSAMEIEQIAREVVNGGFETGNPSGWVTGGYGDHVVTSEDRYSGSYSMLIGYKNSPNVANARDWCYQIIAIPATATYVELSFYYHLFTEDYAPYDWFEVYIRDSTGNNLEQVFYKAGTKPGLEEFGWAQVTYDLSAYAGQTIQLYFAVANWYDTAYKTWCYIDDVSVKYPFNFGYEGDYFAWTGIENCIVGSWFTCPQNGKALAMSIRVARNPGEPSPVRCAIYRKSDGGFVAETEEIYVGDPGYWDPHWVTLEFVTPPYLSAGEDYWLVAWAGGSIYFYIGIQEWETPKLGLQSLTYGNFPTTYSPNIYNYIANIYCTVMPT